MCWVVQEKELVEVKNILVLPATYHSSFEIPSNKIYFAL